MFAALTFPALRERRPQSTEHQILMNNLQICWRIMSRSQKEVHRSLERRTMTAFSASERGGGSANALIGQCFKWFANRLYGQLSRQNPGWSHYQIMFHLAENWRCLQPQDIKVSQQNCLHKFN
jgi:hypothetical protein